VSGPLIPTQDYRRTSYHPPAKLLNGLDALVNGAIGSYHRRRAVFEELKRDAESVDREALSWKELSSGKLKQRLHEFRQKFRRGGREATSCLVPAMAAIREAAERELGMRPFFVQIIGALAMHRGCLAEMATGEGKTLTAGLSAVLNGWTKRPCQIVTVNDYLVERDARRLKPLYDFCGISVGCVIGAMEPADRQKNYGADITYTTSKELLADFLRDRLRIGALHQPTKRLIRRLLGSRDAGLDGLVMRGLHSAIVDEADSVLIDEAVTPLIISTTRENPLLKEAGLTAQKIIADLREGEHYERNIRFKEIELTESGLRHIELGAADLPGVWRGDSRRLELAIQALVAREFFHRDRQYIIEKGKVVIVDEFTGRPMPQRTWREGMHQAIEAKEGLEVSDPSETIARLSFQRFFRCFHKLAGMTGTAREAAAEFWQIYRLPVIAIPTNRPCIREHWPDRIFADEESKWQAVGEEIVRIHATGRPLLIGTRSVAASERLAAALTRQKLTGGVLNAVRIAEESAIIALAGEPGRITIATNMAGRGTDILLGRGVAANGGLHVIATERHESGRVDRQLFGRSGRQGDPGSAQAFVSLEDELLRRHLRPTAQKVLTESARREFSGWQSLTRLAFAQAQRNAQRLAYRQRKAVMRADLWLSEALSFAGEGMV
jgi:preprotein translocase subunit SecA